MTTMPSKMEWTDEQEDKLGKGQLTISAMCTNIQHHVSCPTIQHQHLPHWLWNCKTGSQLPMHAFTTSAGLKKITIHIQFSNFLSNLSSAIVSQSAIQFALCHEWKCQCDKTMWIWFYTAAWLAVCNASVNQIPKQHSHHEQLDSAINYPNSATVKREIITNRYRTATWVQENPDPIIPSLLGLFGLSPACGDH